MRREIYTYALVKSLYNSGEDYIDAFWPIVIRVMPQNFKLIKLPEIRDILKSECGIEIPFHALEAILGRARKKKYIEKKGGKYKLTQEGLKYIEQQETEREVERRINELLEDIKELQIQLEKLFNITEDLLEVFKSKVLGRF